MQENTSKTMQVAGIATINESQATLLVGYAVCIAKNDKVATIQTIHADKSGIKNIFVLRLGWRIFLR